MNIQILKDQNKTEYDHKMQQYNASLLTQKRHKQDLQIKERQEKEWQEHL